MRSRKLLKIAPLAGEPTLPGIIQDSISRVKSLLDTLFETAGDAVFLMHGVRFLDCNPATLKMFGLTEKRQIIDRSPMDFSPVRQPDGSPSSEKARKLVAAALKGQPQRFEWIHCRLDGAEFEVEVRLNRFVMEETAFLVAVVRDISETKRANEKLVETNQFFERLIDSLPATFYLYDSNFRLVRWNRHHDAGMGYRSEEMLGRPVDFWQATEEERREALKTAQRVLHGSGGIELLETELRNKDGTVAPYLVSGARVVSKDGPMLVGIGVNISDRKRAEQALAESERNYRELFNAMNDALFVHDPEGHIIDVNERACAMFGFAGIAEARKLCLEDISAGTPPYSQREASEKVLRAIQEGPQVFDWRSRRRDGTLFWSEVALRASKYEDKIRVIASVRDITERKEAALEREQLIAEAQAANRAKDQFLAVLSHELRNPMAAIRAGVDLLRLFKSFEDPRAVRAMEIVNRNIQLQTRMIGDLLDLSRLERGKLTIKRAPIQLGDTVVSAVDTCRGDADRAKVIVTARADPGLWADADPDRIQQAVINLVGNGIKFTKPGGRVSVSVTQVNGRARIVVEDTGSGIAPALLPDLFQMFRQGTIEARRAPGLGIGLALVKAIAELHDGRAWAESAGPGQGSRFTIELPLREAPAATSEPIRPTESKRTIRMLLVEDNADTRIPLADALSQLSFQVLSAESGEAALEILAHEAVDVLLVDIGLPGMNGYEFLRQSRRLPSTSHAAAFALTGYGQAQDIRSSQEAGFTEHFVKPFDSAELDRRIRLRLG
ncbi:MAG: PAS domain S-box protein [Bdellovibrionota bacterium]